MKTEELVRSLAHRILGRIPRYRAGQFGKEWETLGRYEECDSSYILFGVDRIEVDGEIVMFRDVERVFGPGGKDPADESSRQIRLEVSDGSEVLVNVAGGVENYLDSFEVARFLSRAVGFTRRDV